MLVGGTERHLSRFKEKLAPYDITIAWHYPHGQPRALPDKCEVALMCADSLSHSSFFVVKERCQEKGIPWVRVMYDWIKSAAALVQHKIIPEIAGMEDVLYNTQKNASEDTSSTKPMEAIDYRANMLEWWDQQTEGLQKAVCGWVSNLRTNPALDSSLRKELRKHFQNQPEESTALILHAAEQTSLTRQQIRSAVGLILGKKVDSAIIGQVQELFPEQAATPEPILPEPVPPLPPQPTPTEPFMPTTPEPKPTSLTALEFLNMTMVMCLERGLKVQIQKKDQQFVLAVDGVTIAFS